MKKSIIICVLCILVFAGAANAAISNPISVKPNPEASFSVWIKIIINFHRPKLQCQKGFGICLDFQWGTSENPSGPGNSGCIAEVRVNNANQLELLVSEDDLKNYENGFALSYFRSGSFTLEEPYTFSAGVSGLLGTGKPVTVGNGTYPVVYNPSAKTYTATFPVN